MTHPRGGLPAWAGYSWIGAGSIFFFQELHRAQCPSRQRTVFPGLAPRNRETGRWCVRALGRCKIKPSLVSSKFPLYGFVTSTFKSLTLEMDDTIFFFRKEKTTNKISF